MRAGRQQRDLRHRLRDEIDRAQRLYEERVPPAVGAAPRVFSAGTRADARRRRSRAARRTVVSNQLPVSGCQSCDAPLDSFPPGRGRRAGAGAVRAGAGRRPGRRQPSSRIRRCSRPSTPRCPRTSTTTGSRRGRRPSPPPGTPRSPTRPRRMRPAITRPRSPRRGRPCAAGGPLEPYAQFYVGLVAAAAVARGRRPTRRSMQVLARKPDGHLSAAAMIGKAEAAELRADQAGGRGDLYEKLSSHKSSRRRTCCRVWRARRSRRGDRKRAAEAFQRVYYEFPLTEAASNRARRARLAAGSSSSARTPARSRPRADPVRREALRRGAKRVPGSCSAR